MVDITQPTILGYAITPWLIILCSCVVGTIVFLILVILGFSKRSSKESEMIENAAKNTSGIPINNIQKQKTDLNMDAQDKTELIIADETEKMTEGLDTEVDSLNIKTEPFDISDTEVLETDATEVL